MSALLDEDTTTVIDDVAEPECEWSTPREHCHEGAEYVAICVHCNRQVALLCIRHRILVQTSRTVARHVRCGAVGQMRDILRTVGI